jgi:hypothetical protein
MFEDDARDGHSGRAKCPLDPGLTSHVMCTRQKVPAWGSSEDERACWAGELKGQVRFPTCDQPRGGRRPIRVPSRRYEEGPYNVGSGQLIGCHAENIERSIRWGQSSA